MLKKILVPLDTSALAEQALTTAAEIAKSLSAELRLAIVHQPAPLAGYPDAPWNAARTSMESAYLDGKAQELREQFGIRVVVEQLRGDIAPSLIALVLSRGIDLVVMTTHGRTGLSRSWLGSIADEIMRSVDIPVLMLRPEAESGGKKSSPPSFRRVMIPVDGSSRAECIIDAAVAVAGLDATYVLARAVPPVPAISAFADPYATTVRVADPVATDALAEEADAYVGRISTLLASTGVRSVEHSVVVADSIAARIVSEAKGFDVDLVALGSHGRGTSRFVFGSVADEVLRATRLPILVCRCSGE
jgi:nucleotide-binding universal stress UspA family protein